ncbi:glycosyltransferase family A protein [Halorubrum ejinorense]|uniref:Glycosyltransferase family A protein n=1 Tax=Halorubrum ejinorense TaxID=425309 RepID=A0ABV4IT08_9EURY
MSVVLPTYNRAHTIDAVVESVLRQTYDRFELLVVDDGSTDDTPAVVEDFDDRRIRYVRFRRNRGANVARNAGIRHADGDFLAFVDSDDRWHPEKLERQVRAMRNASDRTGVVYTGYWLEYPSGRQYGPDPDRDAHEGSIHEELLKGNGRFIPTSTALVRRACFEEVGLFDEGLPRQQDWEMWLRISQQFEFGHDPEPLVVKSMDHDEVSISSDEEAQIDAIEHVLEKHAEKFRSRSELLSRHQWQLGQTCLLNGQPRRGRAELLAACKRNPRLLYLLGFGVSILGPRAYGFAFRALEKLPID